MTSEPKKRREIPAILGCPLLLILAVFAIPGAIVARFYVAVRERRLFRRLLAVDRTLPWSEVEQHLQAGTGTLIIEQAQKNSNRLWWTPDDVPSVSRVPVPAFADLDFIRPDPAAPFVSWCFTRYLSVATGSAFLTRPVGVKFPPGFVEPGFFTARYPAARVIATTLTP